MPGKQQLNVRVTSEQAERLKEAALAAKMSLTTFLVQAGLSEADKWLDQEHELVDTSTEMPARPAQELSEKVQKVPPLDVDFSALLEDLDLGTKAVEEVQAEPDMRNWSVAQRRQWRLKEKQR